MKIRETGFTLIELLVTVFIIGVLAAVAMPAYQNYVINGKRKQAEAVMLNLSQMEERYYTNNYAYYPVSSVPPTVDPQGWPNYAGTNMSARTYNLAVTAPTATTYTITATPSNGFVDTQCGILTLNSTGTKGNAGTVPSGTSPCW